MNSLLGGLAGLLVGGAAAGVVAALLPLDLLAPAPPLAIKGFIFLIFGYTGMALGAARGERFTLGSLRAAWAEGGQRQNYKILDTSVIIDGDRKSTRLNSSHLVISYAVFCLKKKKKSK